MADSREIAAGLLCRERAVNMLIKSHKLDGLFDNEPPTTKSLTVFCSSGAEAM